MPIPVALLLLLLLPAAHAQAGLCKWCPRVVPTWAPTWALANSTIAMPCNSSGLIRPSVLAPFSISSIDWSNAKDLWAAGTPMDAETPLVDQALALQAANPQNRVWVYRNLVIAYPWFPTVREKLVDPNFAGWFIKFAPTGPNNGSYYVPRCDNNFSPPLCTDFYHSQDQTPGYPRGDGNCPGPCDCGGVPCGFYLFNHANTTEVQGQTLRSWLLDTFVFGPTGLGHSSKAITGLYLDDHWADAYDSTDAPDCASSPIGGPTEVNVHCTADAGLTAADTAANTANWRSLMLELQQRLVAGGFFSWAFFDTFSGAPSKGAICPNFFRTQGTDFFYNRTLAMSFSSRNRTRETEERDSATFLLVRGPWAFLGQGWNGCVGEPTPLPPAVFLDYGVPLTNLTEASPGVFTRQWSKALVTFDCNSYNASITFGAAEGISQE